MPPRHAPPSRPNCHRIIRSSRAPGRPARVSSPSERIAASENDDQRDRRRAKGAGEFVELHCRRAPRRAGGRRRTAPEKAGRSKAAPKDKGGDKTKADDKTPSNISSKIRSLLVARAWS